MVKLFDSLASLKFTPEDVKDPTGASGMIAKDGEYVEFNAHCNCTGPVIKIPSKFMKLYTLKLI